MPESERPVMFYAGDGVSDLSAAKETDLLFAKKDMGKPFQLDLCSGIYRILMTNRSCYVLC